jgi:hypothetical protein
MKRLLVGAVVAVLCGLPGATRAESHSEPGTVEAPAGEAAPAQRPASDGTEDDLAAREQAAPQQVGEFAGGADGVYITSGAIIVALIIVILLVAL